MENTKYSLSETAAALQLADLPEQADDLRKRLMVAEKRAESAEEAAQEARAELARAVLGAARTEAHALAIRSQAADELEQQAQQLREELAAANAAASASETELARLRVERDQAPGPSPTPNRAGASKGAPKRPNGKTRTAANITGSWRSPNWPRVSQRNLRIGLVTLLAVGTIAVFASRLSLFYGGGLSEVGPSVASNPQSGTAWVTQQDARSTRPEDPDARAVARALATIERETRRLKSVAKATASLRAALARRMGSATVANSAARRPAGSWLLWMPVERETVRSYLMARPRVGPSIAKVNRADGKDRVRSADRRR